MNNENLTNIPGRLHSVALDSEGNKVPVSGADEIFDDKKGKFQKAINEEVDAGFETLGGNLAAEVERASAAETGIDNRLRTVEELAEISIDGGTIGIGTAEDFDDPTTEQRAKVPTIGALIDGADDEPTAGSEKLVKSGGIQNELTLGAVYDVSAKNPTAGPNSDGKWESLSALLSDANLNTLIPTSVRKGGMSIKFVQSSDNKYVQYRLMKNTWSTTVSDWQGVDDEPTASSKNFVTSGGVYSSTPTIANSTTEADLYISDENGNVLIKSKDGHLQTKNFNSKQVVTKLATVEEGAEVNDVDTTNSNHSDLDISDENDNVLVKLRGGHIKTKKFDSSQTATTEKSGLMSSGDKTKLNSVEDGAEVNDVMTEISNNDFELSDEHGNILMKLRRGDIKTKNFDSRDLKQTNNERDAIDFNISDDNGNDIVEFRNGHIKTKNFNSNTLPENTKDSIASILSSLNNLNLVIDNRSVFNIKSVARIAPPVNPQYGDYYYNITNGIFYKYNGSNFINVNTIILPIADTLIFKSDEDNKLYLFKNGTMLPYRNIPRISFVEDDTLFDATNEIADFPFSTPMSFMPALIAKFDTLLKAPISGKNSKLTVAKFDAVSFVNSHIEQENQLSYPEYTQGVTDYHAGDGYVPAYTTPIYKISNEQTSVGYDRENKKHKILLIGGNHGMERQAQFNTYLFAKNLLSNYSNNQNLYNLLVSFDIYILPVLNGYGSLKGWRYNANGVNINRNFNVVGWEVAKPSLSPNPYERDYPGAYPNSEFETQLTIDLCNILKPDIAIDHHSYGSNENTQYYTEGGSLDFSRISFDTACKLGRIFNKNYPQYFGSDIWLPTNNNGSMTVANKNTGTTAQWFFENSDVVRLGGVEEVSDCIGYYDGEYANGTEYDLHGVDTCKISEYTLRTFIVKCAEWVLNNSN